MLKKLIFVTSINLKPYLLINKNVKTEVIPYNSFNYKLSNDENSSNKSYSKLEDNTIINVEVIDLNA